MVGIDISDRSIKVVQLSADGRLLAHCWQAVPEGVLHLGVVGKADVLQRIIIEALQQCRLLPLEKDSVVASLPERQSFLRVVEVPVMAEDEMDEAVQWEVVQHIPFGLENIYTDWQPIGGGHKPPAGRLEVLVGAAQKKVVDSLFAVLQSIHLDVAALELESQAIVRALISSELRRQQGLLVVDLGGSATNVIIHDHGAMRFTASLQRGSRDITKVLSSEEAVRLAKPSGKELPAKLAERMAAKLKPALEELVMEIGGVVEFYNSIDAQHEVKEVLLTGGGSNFPGLDKIFLRFFDNVHVQRGDPWANILPVKKSKKAPLLLRESVHYSTALGLALRHIDR